MTFAECVANSEYRIKYLGDWLASGKISQDTYDDNVYYEIENKANCEFMNSNGWSTSDVESKISVKFTPVGFDDWYQTWDISTDGIENLTLRQAAGIFGHSLRNGLTPFELIS